MVHGMGMEYNGYYGNRLRWITGYGMELYINIWQQALGCMFLPAALYPLETFSIIYILFCGFNIYLPLTNAPFSEFVQCFYISDPGHFLDDMMRQAFFCRYISFCVCLPNSFVVLH